jgi:hypothetical protein
MMPLFANIPDEVLIVIAIPLVGGILIAITAILAGNYRKIQRDDMTATLKVEMIQRGMSPEDIERVLAARMSAPPCRTARRDWQWWPEEQKSNSG